MKGELVKKTDHLEFWRTGVSDSGKTLRYEVHGKSLLGRVSWYAPWRRYAFTPAEDCVFDATCLIEINCFLTDAAREHRKRK